MVPITGPGRVAAGCTADPARATNRLSRDPLSPPTARIERVQEVHHIVGIVQFHSDQGHAVRHGRPAGEHVDDSPRIVWVVPEGVANGGDNGAR